MRAPVLTSLVLVCFWYGATLAVATSSTTGPVQPITNCSDFNEVNATCCLPDEVCLQCDCFLCLNLSGIALPSDTNCSLCPVPTTGAPPPSTTTGAAAREPPEEEDELPPGVIVAIILSAICCCLFIIVGYFTYRRRTLVYVRLRNAGRRTDETIGVPVDLDSDTVGYLKRYAQTEFLLKPLHLDIIKTGWTDQQWNRFRALESVYEMTLNEAGIHENQVIMADPM